MNCKRRATRLTTEEAIGRRRHCAVAESVANKLEATTCLTAHLCIEQQIRRAASASGGTGPSLRLPGNSTLPETRTYETKTVSQLRPLDTHEERLARPAGVLFRRRRGLGTCRSDVDGVAAEPFF